MSPKRKQSKEDIINEPKVVALAGQSYSYGQTPAALCRQHFKEIAERLNMTVEELAKGVLDKSLGDQLCMLRDFYKSKNQETEAIYKPLLEVFSAEVDDDRIPDKSPKKKKKIEKTTVSSIQKKKKPCALLLSSDRDSEEKMSRGDPVPLNKTMEVDRQPINKRPLVRNKTLSRIESSIEATIAFGSPIGLEKDTYPKISIQEPEIANFELNTVEVIPLKDLQSTKTVSEEMAKEPPVMIEHKEATSTEEGPQEHKKAATVTEESPQEDLETLLYGKSPTKSKPPPRRKYHQYSLSQSTSETTTVFDAFDSPSSSQFCPPGLTFEPNSCSPSSHQRDLLSIVRDIAALQKVVASGKKLGDSVSESIKFTNPTE